MGRNTEQNKEESSTGLVRQQGFTLLEVVIAVALLAIISIGLAQALLMGQKHAIAVRKERRVRAICQSAMMELAEMPWGDTTTAGTIEYMRVNSPIQFQLAEFPGETGQIVVTDVSVNYTEKEKTGSVYKIEVKFAQHSFVKYIENIN